jgi:hypothetical protein
MNKIYLIFNFLILFSLSLTKCLPSKYIINNTDYCKKNALNMTNLNVKCSPEWQKRYYYDKLEKSSYKRCKFFWYGGCDWMDTELVYKTEHDCYASCEDKSKIS